MLKEKERLKISKCSTVNAVNVVPKFYSKNIYTSRTQCTVSPAKGREWNKDVLPYRYDLATY